MFFLQLHPGYKTTACHFTQKFYINFHVAPKIAECINRLLTP